MIISPSFFRTVALALLMVAFVMPTGVSAATKKPTCTLSVVTSTGKSTIREKDEDEMVLIDAGQAVTLSWVSKNAKDAEDGNGDAIDLSGSEVVVASTTSTYSYTFSSGNKSATCGVTLSRKEGGFDADTLNAITAKPTLSGTASGVKSVRVIVTKPGSTKKLFASKEIKLRNGAWHTKVTKKIADGTYDIALLGPKSAGTDAIARGTLTIDSDRKKGGKVDATLVVASIPLLGGGTTRAGASVPVSYLQITNTGKEAATLTGFYVKQNGSASTDVVTGFTTVDDKGLIRGASTGTKPFTNGTAFAPTPATTFLPGQMRLFTIKAVLGAQASGSVGQNLMIDVSGVESTAKIGGTFPIKGTTWAISY